MKNKQKIEKSNVFGEQSYVIQLLFKVTLNL